MFRLFCLSAAGTVIFLAAVAVTGFFTPATPRETFLHRHFLPGLVGVLLACFLHSMVISYFLGATEPIRDALKGIEKQQELLRTAAGIRKRGIFWAAIGIVTMIAVAVSGGAADRLVIPRILHLATSVAGIGLTIQCFWQEVLLVAANIHLIREVDMKMTDPKR